MNADEYRLRDIRDFKAFYYRRLSKESFKKDKELIQEKIDELEKEEKEILKRCKVDL